MPNPFSARVAIGLAFLCIAVAIDFSSANRSHAFSSSSEIETRKAPGKCSIADGETLKIASWNIGGRDYQTRKGADAFDGFVLMAQKIDADIFAFQNVTTRADEVVELVAALQSDKRCYSSIVSRETGGGKYAVLYDENSGALLFPNAKQNSCAAQGTARINSDSPLMKIAPGASHTVGASHFAYFRVRESGTANEQNFDFALINAHVDKKSLDEFVQDYQGLDENYPWLADEQDRIIVGDLGVAATPGQLRGNYFPRMKPLINPLLLINLGLSDLSFDEAVAGSRTSTRAPSGNEAGKNFDNILVRRWDRPGTCETQKYCGGLEEFINARVYRYDKALVNPPDNFEEAVSSHNPVAARFCKFADTDPFVEVLQ